METINLNWWNKLHIKNAVPLKTSQFVQAKRKIMREFRNCGFAKTKTKKTAICALQTTMLLCPYILRNRNKMIINFPYLNSAKYTSLQEYMKQG